MFGNPNCECFTIYAGASTMECWGRPLCQSSNMVTTGHVNVDRVHGTKSCTLCSKGCRNYTGPLPQPESAPPPGPRIALANGAPLSPKPSKLGQPPALTTLIGANKAAPHTPNPDWPTGGPRPLLAYHRDPPGPGPSLALPRPANWQAGPPPCLCQGPALPSPSSAWPIGGLGPPSLAS
jgi:hypothetical protein